MGNQDLERRVNGCWLKRALKFTGKWIVAPFIFYMAGAGIGNQYAEHYLPLYIEPSERSHYLPGYEPEKDSDFFSRTNEHAVWERDRRIMNKVGILTALSYLALQTGLSTRKRNQKSKICVKSMTNQGRQRTEKRKSVRIESIMGGINTALGLAGVIGAGAIFIGFKTGYIPPPGALYFPDGIDVLGLTAEEEAKLREMFSIFKPYKYEPRISSSSSIQSKRKGKFLFVFGESLNPGSLEVVVLIDKEHKEVKVGYYNFGKISPEKPHVLEKRTLEYRQGLFQEILDSYDPNIFLKYRVNPVEIEKVKEMLEKFMQGVDKRYAQDFKQEAPNQNSTKHPSKTYFLTPIK